MSLNSKLVDPKSFFCASLVFLPEKNWLTLSSFPTKQINSKRNLAGQPVSEHLFKALNCVHFDDVRLKTLELIKKSLSCPVILSIKRIKKSSL